MYFMQHLGLASPQLTSPGPQVGRQMRVARSQVTLLLPARKSVRPLAFTGHLLRVLHSAKESARNPHSMGTQRPRPLYTIIRKVSVPPQDSNAQLSSPCVFSQTPTS